MAYCLISETNDCKNCYRCLRKCPIKSVSFVDNESHIIHDDCIYCGKCFLECPQNVIKVRDDLAIVKRLIRAGRKVVASIAPSFISYYKEYDIDSFKEIFIKLGFHAVEETAIGATIVKKAYENMLDDEHDVVISSCCHTINLLVQKYYPRALPYLADVLSPMLAHGKDIKERYGSDTKVVFIGPCISKKDETDKNHEYVDVALTFEELEDWFTEEDIRIEPRKEKDIENKSRARLFPTCGGVLATMNCDNKDYEYVAIDGIDECKEVLQDIINGTIHKCFIEMSACYGSCINGPLVQKRKHSIVNNKIAIKNNAGKEDFDGYAIKPSDIQKPFSKIAIRHAIPSEEAITRTLIDMGKETKEKQLNCGSCGYSTCREKAIAIIQGKAVKEMCLPFLMEKAQSFSDKIVANTPDGLMVLNENLDIQLINNSMCRIVGIPNSKYVLNKNITTIMDPVNFCLALAGEKIYNKKTYLSEYKKYVENTIVYDEKFHVLICIIRDITNSELSLKNREETLKKSIEITDNVIAQNMRAVQEIASLLGESAAATKVALSSLKETLKNDK